VAAKKGGLDSIKASISGFASRAKLGDFASRAKLGGLASRLPFAKRASASTPEPFATIEDDTPVGDLLSSQNAAPPGPTAKAGRERPDIRGLLEAAIRSRNVVIGTLTVLALLLIVSVVAVLVSLPPAAPKEAKPFTQAGETIVKTWLLPPGDSLEPRVEMERSGHPTYRGEDAAKIGLPADPAAATSLIEKNDEAIEDLYGTVP
jgi:hypothetical protein